MANPKICPFLKKCVNYVTKEDFAAYCLTNKKKWSYVTFENCKRQRQGTLHSFEEGTEQVLRLTMIHFHKHTHWQPTLRQCHNAAAGCWCCVCQGFMCGCDCHRSKLKMFDKEETVMVTSCFPSKEASENGKPKCCYHEFSAGKGICRITGNLVKPAICDFAFKWKKETTQ